ncbi:acyltransferase family protein [Marinicella litoralis]|uniref:Peptidoglycan/LPS O-acetylase OafA/YrhL n=1 Tax=Marinicella litoralis TaxID=644220 RepID=A0A4R6XUT6_9GAMM|nr:acyltransferase family protein [Marinicella litoralis]TDR23772.1 peptidoglycan/LPS O-acetylase OafA/YrhL [Marinicella litoralis]
MLPVNRHNQFRGEIQGLRAVAILGVLAYHCGFAMFSGGFLGVDVFFTISGYLISQLILRQLQDNSFSLKTFYIRRIRRLFPALFVTVLFTGIMALLVFPAELVQKTFQSAIAAFFSVSNFYFLSEAGYWDFSAKFKPLLHTWSLGIEEQFYLVFPLLLMFLYRKQNLSMLVKVLLMLLFLSLLLSVIITKINPHYAFYLIPFRMFEFLVGAVVCFMPDSKKLINSKVAEWLVVSSLTTIILCFVYFDQTSSFPGYLPLLPCLSCVIIIYLKNVKISQWLLGNKVMLYIGNISYSWYLVHWPLIVFYTFISPNKLTAIDKIILILASLVLSVVLYKTTESTFRYGHEKEKYFAGFAWVTLAFFCVAVINEGRFFQAKNPVQNVISLPAKVANLKRHEQWSKQCETQIFITPDRCLKPSMTKENVLVVGDSHGIDGFNIMNNAFPQYHYMLISERGCPHLFEAVKRENDSCDRSFDDIVAYLEKNSEVKHVIYSIKMDQSRLNPLLVSIERLKGMTVNVIVMGVGPWYSKQTRIAAHNSDDFLVAQSNIDQFLIKDLFKQNDQARTKISEAGAVYVDKLAYFCKQPSCMAFTLDQQEMVTYDRTHLSIGASKDFASYLVNKYDSRNFFNDK